MIEGRKEEESVSRDGVRPVPPPDPSWAPAVGATCELLYMEGWWPVRVKRQEGREWHVLYEAFGVQHVVGRCGGRWSGSPTSRRGGRSSEQVRVYGWRGVWGELLAARVLGSGLVSVDELLSVRG